MTKKRRSSQAVSEVLDIVLLLGITIGLFAFLNYIVFSYSFQPSAPSVNLVGSIDKTNGIITIEHNGGESLDGKTQIIITIGSDTTPSNVIDLLSDTNGDGKWNFGETVQFPYYGDTTSSYIRAIVIDPSTNTLILSAVLQQGSTASVITNDPPTFTSPDPTGGGIPITTTLLSITIQDPEGDPFSWTITTSPNIGTSSGNNELNGTKTCTIAGLADSTTYTWTVKAFDGHHWTNKNYIFITSSCPVTDTLVNTISPYLVSVNPFMITSTGDSGLDSVTLHYRWSDDNSSWDGGNSSWNNDTVDWNGPNKDSSADKGIETNFINVQGTSPDTNVMILQEANQGWSSGSENLNVNNFDNTAKGWSATTTPPYLNADDSENVFTQSNGATEAWFNFSDTTGPSAGVYSVILYVKAWGDGNDWVNPYIDYTGGAGSDMGDFGKHSSESTYDSINLGTTFTRAQVNAMRLKLIYTRSPPASNLFVDHAYLAVSWNAVTDYELNTEYQFNNSAYNRDNEQICFYLTAAPTETLVVSYYNAGWVSLGNIVHTGWTNFTANGLTNVTYNIQIKDQNQTNEITQHTWTIDVIMLHTWNSTGGSHGQNWAIWSDANNPDTSTPWSWNFNFPKGIGYYEFYSIGKCGGNIETAPVSADARCQKT
ncbi:Uncharacterised protein [uncultured archaeon]|nr:Uncharacterised protein [uncultured archaeon]